MRGVVMYSVTSRHSPNCGTLTSQPRLRFHPGKTSGYALQLQLPYFSQSNYNCTSITLDFCLESSSSESYSLRNTWFHAITETDLRSLSKHSPWYTEKTFLSLPRINFVVHTPREHVAHSSGNLSVDSVRKTIAVMPKLQEIYLISPMLDHRFLQPDLGEPLVNEKLFP